MVYFKNPKKLPNHTSDNLSAFFLNLCCKLHYGCKIFVDSTSFKTIKDSDEQFIELIKISFKVYQFSFNFRHTKSVTKMNYLNKFIGTFLTFAITIDARSINLSQKELQSIGDVLEAALKNHHLTGKQSHKILGKFTLEESELSPDDFDITIDVDISNTQYGQLSG